MSLIIGLGLLAAAVIVSTTAFVIYFIDDFLWSDDE